MTLRKLLAFSNVFVCALVGIFAFLPEVLAQDTTQGLNLTSPRYSKAEMTRAQIEAQLKSGNKNFYDKSLNGLDLSGMNLSGANFREARLDKTKFAGAHLQGANFNQTWALGADFSGADLTNASLYAAQMQGANFDDADLSGARLIGNFSGTHMRKAKFVKADLSADMKNQNMNLMHVTLRSSDLQGANFKGANLARIDFSFANLGGVNFENADLTGADASGADLRGATFDNTNLNDCDVTSATIDKSQIQAFAKAANLDRALKQ